MNPQASMALAHSGSFGNDCRHRAFAAEAQARSAVLVPVPTSRKDVFHDRSDDVVLADRRFDAADLLRGVAAFRIDKEARRLSGLRMSVGFAARAHAVSEKGKRSDAAWMVTTTYAVADGWRPDHWSKAVMGFRKWANCKGFAARYVWVAELQEKRFERTGDAVIHYHAIFWLPQGVRMPKWDVRGWWKHGRCHRVPVRKTAVGYLMKYLSKATAGSFAKFPKGARIYGCGGLDHSLRRAKRWLSLPRFVQGNSSINDAWVREIGGGWRAPGGAHFPSEFRRIMVAGEGALIRVCQHSIRISPAGPFSWLTDRVLQ